MTDKQQTFEDVVNRAVRGGEEAARTTAEAASLALDLGDSIACGALHAYREVLVGLIERMEGEKEAVHIRLAESYEKGSQGSPEAVCGLERLEGTIGTGRAV